MQRWHKNLRWTKTTVATGFTTTPSWVTGSHVTQPDTLIGRFGNVGFWWKHSDWCYSFWMTNVGWSENSYVIRLFKAWGMACKAGLLQWLKGGYVLWIYVWCRPFVRNVVLLCLFKIPPSSSLCFLPELGSTPFKSQFFRFFFAFAFSVSVSDM